jgi:hypothetical protein
MTPATDSLRVNGQEDFNQLRSLIAERSLAHSMRGRLETLSVVQESVRHIGNP